MLDDFFPNDIFRLFGETGERDPTLDARDCPEFDLFATGDVFAGESFCFVRGEASLPFDGDRDVFLADGGFSN